MCNPKPKPKPGSPGNPAKPNPGRTILGSNDPEPEGPRTASWWPKPVRGPIDPDDDQRGGIGRSLTARLPGFVALLLAGRNPFRPGNHEPGCPYLTALQRIGVA